jgi:hypothetical protein
VAGDAEAAVTTYGYARVSTRGQETTIQEEALRSAGCDRIHHEKVSGAKSDNRPQLCRLLKLVDVGDVVIVTRLDRLARSTRDLLNIVHTIGEADATFKSLAEPWADTTSDHGKLIFIILGGLAEFERSLIRSRTEAGIAKARELGVQSVVRRGSILDKGGWSPTRTLVGNRWPALPSGSRLASPRCGEPCTERCRETATGGRSARLHFQCIGNVGVGSRSPRRARWFLPPDIAFNGPSLIELANSAPVRVGPGLFF